MCQAFPSWVYSDTQYLYDAQCLEEGTVVLPTSTFGRTSVEIKEYIVLDIDVRMYVQSRLLLFCGLHDASYRNIYYLLQEHSPQIRIYKTSLFMPFDFRPVTGRSLASSSSAMIFQRPTAFS